MVFKIISLIIPIFFFSLTLKEFSTPDRIAEKVVTYLFILIHGLCLFFPNTFTLWLVVFFQTVFFIGLLSLMSKEKPIGVLYYFLPVSLLFLIQEICKH